MTFAEDDDVVEVRLALQATSAISASLTTRY
jgi:hypothetical protein